MCIGQTCLDIGRFQERVFAEEPLWCITGGEHPEHVLDREPMPRMIGLPPNMAGSTVIRRSNSSSPAALSAVSMLCSVTLRDRCNIAIEARDDNLE